MAFQPKFKQAPPGPPPTAIPPQGAGGAPAPGSDVPMPPPSPALGKSLAQLSAMGTTGGTAPGAGSPVPMPPPDPLMMQDAPEMPPAGPPTPPRPVVAPHVDRSVGTHASRSPVKRSDPSQGSGGGY